MVLERSSCVWVTISTRRVKGGMARVLRSVVLTICRTRGAGLRTRRRVVFWGQQARRGVILRRGDFAQVCRVDITLVIHGVVGIQGISLLLPFIGHGRAIVHVIVTELGVQIAAVLIVLEGGLVERVWLIQVLLLVEIGIREGRIGKLATGQCLVDRWIYALYGFLLVGLR